MASPPASIPSGGVATGGVGSPFAPAVTTTAVPMRWYSPGVTQLKAFGRSLKKYGIEEGLARSPFAFMLTTASTIFLSGGNVPLAFALGSGAASASVAIAAQPLGKYLLVKTRAFSDKVRKSERYQSVSLKTKSVFDPLKRAFAIRRSNKDVATVQARTPAQEAHANTPGAKSTVTPPPAPVNSSTEKDRFRLMEVAALGQ